MLGAQALNLTIQSLNNTLLSRSLLLGLGQVLLDIFQLPLKDLLSLDLLSDLLFEIRDLLVEIEVLLLYYGGIGPVSFELGAEVLGALLERSDL